MCVDVSTHSHNLHLRRGLGNASSRTATEELKMKVLYEYPPAFLNQIAIPCAKSNGKIFRFAYVGGMIFVRDQNARLYWGDRIRKAAVGGRDGGACDVRGWKLSSRPLTF